MRRDDIQAAVSDYWSRRAPAAAQAGEYAQPRCDAEDLLGIRPAAYRRPVDMREVVARIVDGSDFREFGALYGAATVCGGATSRGSPLTVRRSVSDMG